MSTALLLEETDGLWCFIRGQVDGLTTDEMLWEPVPGCWTMRRRADGSFLQDWNPAPPYAPFATIAWRLAHISTCFAAYAADMFGHGTFSFQIDDGRLVGTDSGLDASGDADEALRFLDLAFGRWRDGIAESGDAVSAEVSKIVRSRNAHQLAHSAEIGVLRHLFRAIRPLDANPFVDAAMRGDRERMLAFAREDPDALGAALRHHPDLVLTAARLARWHVLETLIDLGFAVDTEGTTALHWASAQAPLQYIRMLVERGAQLDRRDPQWNATPSGWAQHFGYTRAIEYLESRGSR